MNFDPIDCLRFVSKEFVRKFNELLSHNEMPHQYLKKRIHHTVRPWNLRGKVFFSNIILLFRKETPLIKYFPLMQYNALLSFLVFISSFSSLFQAHRREPLYEIEIIVKKDALTFSRSQNFFIKKYTILFKSDFQFIVRWC